MIEPLTQGWLTTEQAEELTGYSVAYLRRLANQGRVEACKVGRDWVLYRDSLLAYKERMDTLGLDKHNPWREDLTDRGRGRPEAGEDN
ncbi:MAG: helix-turn-helix domain-containing protein [Anaerolineae bacterium]|nr:helix-turn-helix domain-containing protein [Anaerolineae bacterium]